MFYVAHIYKYYMTRHHKVTILQYTETDPDQSGGWGGVSMGFCGVHVLSIKQ